jgi:hypothetical protein
MFKSYNKLKLLPALAVSALLLVTGSCNQDSIFNYISSETAPTQAKIKGAPSRIVGADIVVNGAVNPNEKLYVANGNIWEYAPAQGWQRIAGPGKFVADVAAIADGVSDSVVYAYAIDNTSTGVWKKNGAAWTPVAPPSDYRFIQNIFGAKDVLFAGAKRADNNYAILYLKQAETEFKVLPGTEGTDLLSGAGVAGGSYYLATMGSGIYQASGFGGPDAPSVVPLTATPSIPATIAGFLQAKTTAGDDCVVGVSRSGYILYIDPSGLKAPGVSLGGTYSGALALMEYPNPPTGGDKLLLLGYEGSGSYNHGYMELFFNIDTGQVTGDARAPGANQPSSVQNSDQYESSLRRYPVTSLWVLPRAGGDPSIIFAATTNQGLYSYRLRSDGGWQWNHEE